MTLAHLALSRGAVDRDSAARSDPHLLERLWDDPATRLVRVAAGQTPASGPPGAPRLDAVPPSAVPGPALRAYLGTDAAGVRWVAAEVPGPAELTDPGDGGERWHDLRALGAVLPDDEAGLLTTAVALLRWHAVHTHCPRCGAPTVVEAAGWVRRCPEDGSEHFPRTDPAVIMAITDADDRLLLGHNPAWPAGRYSCLAGFVEPGESLEAAVRRETLEEVGVLVGEVTYLGSQPWPFPASLMLGFSGRAVDASVRTDDVEITDARWFARADVLAAVQDGEVLLPPGVSIARRLVEHWYGAPLPHGPAAWDR